MDRLVNQANSKDLIIVMSECTDKVRCVFLDEHKGITILKGEGGYTSETQRVILGAAGEGGLFKNPGKKSAGWIQGFNHCGGGQQCGGQGLRKNAVIPAGRLCHGIWKGRMEKWLR